MSETAKLFESYGPWVFSAAFIAIVFFVGRWVVSRLDRDHEQAREDRDAYHAATIGFTQVVENHMTHDTAAWEDNTRQTAESHREMIRMLERVCYHLDMPNHDYYKTGGGA